VTKEYLAITVGVPIPPDGSTTFTVDAAIDRHPTEETARMIVPPTTATGKPAATAFRVESANASVMLVESREGDEYWPGSLWHERGARIGGASAAAGAARDDDGQQDRTRIDGIRGAALVRCFPKTGRTHQIRLHLAHAGHPIISDTIYGVVGPWMARQALHAHALTVTNPVTGQRLRMAAPLPEDFRVAMGKLGLEVPEDAA